MSEHQSPRSGSGTGRRPANSLGGPPSGLPSDRLHEILKEQIGVPTLYPTPHHDPHVVPGAAAVTELLNDHKTCVRLWPCVYT